MASTLANTDFYRKTFCHDDPKSAMNKKKGIFGGHDVSLITLD
jgi:hypothetical protein